jgi:glutamine synthetase
LRGIEENYQLISPDIHEQLPTNLDEAIRAMESSDLVRDALGLEVFEFVLRNKKAEWAEYSRQVSEYELERYLPVL